MARVCPQCGGDPKVPAAAEANCERYRSTPVVRARCCGFGVRLVPHFHVTLEAAARDMRSDLFGVALNKD